VNIVDRISSRSVAASTSFTVNSPPNAGP
jgi:hypothetical protein